MVPQAYSKKPERSLLARRMFTLIIVVSFAPLVLVTGLVIEKFQSAYKASTHAQLRIMVDKHADMINTFLREKRNDLIFLASLLDLEALDDSSYLQNCLQFLQTAYGPVFEDLSIIDASGRQTAYAGPFDLLHAAYADTDWFQQAMQHPVFTSDVFTGYRGYPHFVVTVKLSGRETPCLLRTTIRFETFVSLIENLKIGQTGSAFIVNATGLFQTQPKSPLFGKSMKPADISQKIQQADPSRKLAETIHELFDKILCLTAPLNEGGWLLVYLQDPSDAYDKLNRAIKTAVVIFFLGGGGIIIMAFYLPARLLLGPAETEPEHR